MKISIRPTRFDSGLTMLNVFRPRERSYSLPGKAHETPSGHWIMVIPNKPMDVVHSRAEAEAALQSYYATRDSAF